MYAAWPAAYVLAKYPPQTPCTTFLHVREAKGGSSRSLYHSFNRGDYPTRGSPLRHGPLGSLTCHYVVSLRIYRGLYSEPHTRRVLQTQLRVYHTHANGLLRVLFIDHVARWNHTSVPRSRFSLLWHAGSSNRRACASIVPPTARRHHHNFFSLLPLAPPFGSGVSSVAAGVDGMESEAA